jgi:hypothetical protein
MTRTSQRNALDCISNSEEKNEQETTVQPLEILHTEFIQYKMDEIIVC